MSSSSIRDLSRLAVHTITTKPWPLETAIEKYAAAGIKGMTVWRDALAGRDVTRAGQQIREAGLTVVSLCRGGFFAATTREARTAALEDNRRAIEEAHLLGAPSLVLVCGSAPGQSLVESRRQIRNGLAILLPHAYAAGVKLLIEPLHPMYAGDRSAVNTLGQANDLCEELHSPALGVALDVFHVWWDPCLEEEIIRSARLKALDAFHLSDWKLPLLDLLNDRGLMGEGCIPLPRIRDRVEAAGFKGFHEVEIFSTRHWAGNQDAFLSEIIHAYRYCC